MFENLSGSPKEMEKKKKNQRQTHESFFERAEELPWNRFCLCKYNPFLSFPAHSKGQSSCSYTTQAPTTRYRSNIFRTNSGNVAQPPPPFLLHFDLFRGLVLQILLENE
ncbi:hypothetical protein CEXT_334241 [Caerostris extrusa]|uniref:Uncharacterized protein n=1 Tax=Caerostris extrusa TaxID=172846 RepID=A0AAV4X6Q5_CAEEX|nr:hypothetical protein CEXT_334241 [Caerostris extrusa]